MDDDLPKISFRQRNRNYSGLNKTHKSYSRREPESRVPPLPDITYELGDLYTRHHGELPNLGDHRGRHVSYSDRLPDLYVHRELDDCQGDSLSGCFSEASHVITSKNSFYREQEMARIERDHVKHKKMQEKKRKKRLSVDMMRSKSNDILGELFSVNKSPDCIVLRHVKPNKVTKVSPIRIDSESCDSDFDIVRRKPKKHAIIKDDSDSPDHYLSDNRSTIIQRDNLHMHTHSEDVTHAHSNNNTDALFKKHLMENKSPVHRKFKDIRNYDLNSPKYKTIKSKKDDKLVMADEITLPGKPGVESPPVKPRIGVFDILKTMKLSDIENNHEIKRMKSCYIALSGCDVLSDSMSKKCDRSEKDMCNVIPTDTTDHSSCNEEQNPESCDLNDSLKKRHFMDIFPSDCDHRTDSSSPKHSDSGLNYSFRSSEYNDISNSETEQSSNDSTHSLCQTDLHSVQKVCVYSDISQDSVSEIAGTVSCLSNKSHGNIPSPLVFVPSHFDSIHGCKNPDDCVTENTDKNMEVQVNNDNAGPGEHKKCVSVICDFSNDGEGVDKMRVETERDLDENHTHAQFKSQDSQISNETAPVVALTESCNGKSMPNCWRSGVNDNQVEESGGICNVEETVDTDLSGNKCIQDETDSAAGDETTEREDTTEHSIIEDSLREEQTTELSETELSDTDSVSTVDYSVDDSDSTSTVDDLGDTDSLSTVDYSVGESGIDADSDDYSTDDYTTDVSDTESAPADEPLQVKEAFNVLINEAYRASLVMNIPCDEDNMSYNGGVRTPTPIMSFDRELFTSDIVNGILPVGQNTMDSDIEYSFISINKFSEAGDCGEGKESMTDDVGLGYADMTHGLVEGNVEKVSVRKREHGEMDGKTSESEHLQIKKLKAATGFDNSLKDHENPYSRNNSNNAPTDSVVNNSESFNDYEEDLPDSFNDLEGLPEIFNDLEDLPDLSEMGHGSSRAQPKGMPELRAISPILSKLNRCFSLDLENNQSMNRQQPDEGTLPVVEASNMPVLTAVKSPLDSPNAIPRSVPAAVPVSSHTSRKRKVRWRSAPQTHEKLPKFPPKSRGTSMETSLQFKSVPGKKSQSVDIEDVDRSSQLGHYIRNECFSGHSSRKGVLPAINTTLLQESNENGVILFDHFMSFLSHFHSNFHIPSDITELTIENFLLSDRASIGQIHSAYSILVEIVKSDCSAIDLKWSDIDICIRSQLNCDLSCKSTKEILMNEEYLQLVLLVLKTDLYGRDLLSLSEIRRSKAYRLLSHDLFPVRRRSIVRYLQQAMHGMANNQPQERGLSAMVKLLEVLQEFLRLSIEISSSCRDMAVSLASELKHVYQSLPNLSTKHLLLHQCTSELLLFYLTKVILETHFDNTLPLCKFNLDAVVTSFFKAEPEVCAVTPPTMPSSDAPRVPGCVPEQIEELAMLIYLVTKTYIQVSINKLHVVLYKRSQYPPEKLCLCGSDVKILRDWSSHANTLHKHVAGLGTDLTPRTSQYLMMTECLADTIPTRTQKQPAQRSPSVELKYPSNLHQSSPQELISSSEQRTQKTTLLNVLENSSEVFHSDNELSPEKRVASCMPTSPVQTSFTDAEQSTQKTTLLNVLEISSAVFYSDNELSPEKRAASCIPQSPVQTSFTDAEQSTQKTTLLNVLEISSAVFHSDNELSPEKRAASCIPQSPVQTSFTDAEQSTQKTTLLNVLENSTEAFHTDNELSPERRAASCIPTSPVQTSFTDAEQSTQKTTLLNVLENSTEAFPSDSELSPEKRTSSCIPQSPVQTSFTDAEKRPVNCSSLLNGRSSPKKCSLLDEGSTPKQCSSLDKLSSSKKFRLSDEGSSPKKCSLLDKDSSPKKCLVEKGLSPIRFNLVDKSSSPIRFNLVDKGSSPIKCSLPDDGSIPKKFTLVDKGSSPLKCSLLDEGSSPKKCNMLDEISSSKKCNMLDEMTSPKKCILLDEGSSPTKVNILNEGSSPVKDNILNEGSSPNKGNILNEGSSPVKGNILNECSSPIKGNILNECSSPIKGNILNEASSPVKDNILNEGSSPVKGNILNEGSSPIKGNILNEASSPVKSNILNEASSLVKGNILNEASSPIKGNILNEGSSPIKGYILSEGSSPIKGYILSEGSNHIKGYILGEGSSPIKGYILGEGSSPIKCYILGEGSSPESSPTKRWHQKYVYIE